MSEQIYTDATGETYVIDPFDVFFVEWKKRIFAVIDGLPSWVRSAVAKRELAQVGWDVLFQQARHYDPKKDESLDQCLRKRLLGKPRLRRAMIRYALQNGKRGLRGTPPAGHLTFVNTADLEDFLDSDSDSPLAGGCQRSDGLRFSTKSAESVFFAHYDEHIKGLLTAREFLVAKLLAQNLECEGKHMKLEREKVARALGITADGVDKFRQSARWKLLKRGEQVGVQLPKKILDNTRWEHSDDLERSTVADTFQRHDAVSSKGRTASKQRQRRLVA